jgi:exopolysaccharide biosynthesis protein
VDGLSILVVDDASGVSAGIIYGNLRCMMRQTGDISFQALLRDGGGFSNAGELRE